MKWFPFCPSWIGLPLRRVHENAFVALSNTLINYRIRYLPLTSLPSKAEKRRKRDKQRFISWRKSTLFGGLGCDVHCPCLQACSKDPSETGKPIPSQEAGILPCSTASPVQACLPDQGWCAQASVRGRRLSRPHHMVTPGSARRAPAVGIQVLTTDGNMSGVSLCHLGQVRASEKLRLWPVPC